MRAAEWMDRRQVMLYLCAIVAGALVGLLSPAAAAPAGVVVTPLLGGLLYVTFLGVPFARIGAALRDGRFLLTVLIVNFVAAPLVVLPLSRIVAHDDALLAGVLLVLLTPCVDYVIVFTALAGGAHERLLATAPVLMLAQMLLLPAYLWLLGPADLVARVDPAPFVHAFVVLIALPLVAAALSQLAAARFQAGAAVLSGAQRAMVPLMMLTLAAVVASQIGAIGQRLGSLLVLLPIYILFPAVMAAVAAGAARLARIDVPGRRAVVFSGVTRNSLVVLPLALALPASFALAPLVVVAQTLVELLVMVAMVRILPCAIPRRAAITSA